MGFPGFPVFPVATAPYTPDVGSVPIHIGNPTSTTDSTLKQRNLREISFGDQRERLSDERPDYEFIRV